MESVFLQFEAVPFEWGALGYRPDLFGDESPNPIIFASRRKNKYKTIKCGIQEPPVLGMVWGGAPIVSAF